MRLLDSVARCHVPLVIPSALDPSVPFHATGPSRFAAQVAGCPLRFVLGDDLAQASAELAFADGARLVGCLDLLRMPAQNLWIEWNDEVHKRVIHETQSAAQVDSCATGRKVGILLRAAPDGLAAVGRTFWADAASDESAEVTLSPLETHFDLRGDFAPEDGRDILSGAFLDATHSRNCATATLLDHVRFRFDESWADYYRPVAADPEFRQRLITESVNSIAWDAPLILAFLLLLSAKDATRKAPVSRAAINRKRLANGRSPLLDHIEVNASLDALSSAAESGGENSGRQSPRLHHVRGHLVRREDRVFWRVPHLRGSGTRGAVRSRTVCLSFARRAGAGHEARV